MNTPIGLSAKNVSWSAPRTNKMILHPVSFDLEAGKVFGIVTGLVGGIFFVWLLRQKY